MESQKLKYPSLRTATRKVARAVFDRQVRTVMNHGLTDFNLSAKIPLLYEDIPVGTLILFDLERLLPRSPDSFCKQVPYAGHVEHLLCSDPKQFITETARFKGANTESYQPARFIINGEISGEAYYYIRETWFATMIPTKVGQRLVCFDEVSKTTKKSAYSWSSEYGYGLSDTALVVGELQASPSSHDKTRPQLLRLRSLELFESEGIWEATEQEYRERARIEILANILFRRYKPQT